MHFIIVRRGHHDKFRFLNQTITDRGVQILWDRRRRRARGIDSQRDTSRQSDDRRRPVPASWTNLDFLVAPAEDRLASQQTAQSFTTAC
jgi:hypothetical protein